MSRTEPTPVLEIRPAGRLGPWFAAIWLFFLIDPLVAGWQLQDRVRGLTGIAVTVVFGILYMTVWLGVRRDRITLVPRATLVRRVVLLAVLVVLGVAMVGLLGEPGTAASVYIAVGAVMVLPLRWAAGVVLGDAVIVLVLGPLAGWGNEIGLAFSVLAASVAIFGLRSMLTRNTELVEAHRVNAELAVDNERNRFARDLHDILGHSLTVITVKAELANKMIDVDPARARAELADLERLSRDALADVRRAVHGYRDLTLPGELARAREALRAADIAADLPNSTDEVPSDLRELFAWTVREGVTNVIRHSGASHCEVRLAPHRVEVRDDGAGPCEREGSGQGLEGLRERASAAGAVLMTRTVEPRGFALCVDRSAGRLGAGTA